MTASVSGVVLAAGLSSRFEAGTGGTVPKQLYRIDGETLVRRICRSALASRLAEVTLVTGHARRRIGAEVADLELRVIHNPDYAAGQSGSVRRGLATIAADTDGAMFLPVDQPGLDATVIDRLVDSFDDRYSIVVPTFRGRRGAPVTFGRRWFSRLEELRGDQGARPLLGALAEHVLEVELDSPRALEDVDTEPDARSWARVAARP